MLSAKHLIPLMVVSLLLTQCSSFSTAVTEAPAGLTGTIAFISATSLEDDSTLKEIHLYDFANGQERRFTLGEYYVGYSALSPDGKKVVFAASQEGDNEIYVWDLESGEVEQLTFNEIYDGKPAWSPDGEWIAFASDRYGERHIYIMEADGSSQRRVTIEGYGGDAPTWSPDGLQIAYYSHRGYDERAAFCTDLYIVDLESGGYTRLTEDPNWDIMPAWSPDGRYIAFESLRGHVRWHYTKLFLLDLETGEIRRLVDDTVEGYPRPPEEYVPTTYPTPQEFISERRPSWSPDGKWLAFGMAGDIYIISVDGEYLTSIITGEGVGLPSWSQ